MFTSFDSHIPAVQTGLARAPKMTRGWIQADAAQARRIEP